MTKRLPFNTAPLPMKLRIEDYEVLAGSGAFENYAKTELIDGEILFMNAQHRPHGIVKMKLYDAMRDALKALDSPFRAVMEFSIALPPDSMPEPDIALTSEPRGEGPVPLHSVALVIEVSDASLEYDLGRKATLHTRHGVPEYWVADVEGQTIHQMWGTVDGAYAERRALAFGKPIAMETISELVVDTAGLA